jgi:trimethylamine:corrinoid methyltransferase-like protein
MVLKKYLINHKIIQVSFDLSEYTAEVVAVGTLRLLDAIKTCPSEFTLHARNPERNVQIGGKNLVFAQVASPPNCSDMQGGRRAGNQAGAPPLLLI